MFLTTNRNKWLGNKEWALIRIVSDPADQLLYVYARYSLDLLSNYLSILFRLLIDESTTDHLYEAPHAG